MKPSLDLIRSFIAVEIPDDVKDEIERIITRFRYKNYPVRWVARSHVHLTLVFLGENPADFVQRSQAALAKAAKLVAPFGMSLRNLGVFPHEHAPRVVWVGVDQGAAELKAMAAAVQRELVTIGFIPERRPFAAHLTIGRVKEPMNEVKSILAKPYASRLFPVTHAVFFRSTLLPTGPVYEHLADIELTAESARPTAHG